MIAGGRSSSSCGFTLVELLVSISIFGIVAAISISSLREVTADMTRLRAESFAVLQNLAFLDTLGHDVRRCRGIDFASADRILLAPVAGNDTIVWTLSPAAARRIVGDRETVFPLQVESLVIAPRVSDGPGRYLIVRGDFVGLGRLQRGMAVRVESEEIR